MGVMCPSRGCLIVEFSTQHILDNSLRYCAINFAAAAALQLLGKLCKVKLGTSGSYTEVWIV